MPDFCRAIQGLDVTYAEPGSGLSYPDGLHELWNACDWCDERWSLDNQPHLRALLMYHAESTEDWLSRGVGARCTRTAVGCAKLRRMAIWHDSFPLDVVEQHSHGTLVSHLGIEFVEAGDEHVTARMPVDARTQQPARMLHGGASVVLAETLASWASTFVVDREKHHWWVQRQPRASRWFGVGHRHRTPRSLGSVDVGVQEDLFVLERAPSFSVRSRRRLLPP